MRRTRPSSRPRRRTALAAVVLWRFDPAAKTWTVLAPLPAPRGVGALVLDGRTLHFFGGADINRKDSASHWTLDLDRDTAWQTAAPLPNARSHLGAVEVDGLVYAVGGQHHQNKHAIAQGEVDAWDPATGRWTLVAPLPTARSHVNASTAVFQGRIVVAGGDPTPNLPTDAVDAYDPMSGAWSTLAPLPQPDYAGIAVSMGSMMVSTTGATPVKSILSYRGTAAP